MKISIKCLAVFLAAAAPFTSAFGAAGELDTSFNPGIGATGLVLATAVQPDGKIIIGGSFTSYNGVAQNRLARLNADGSLDSSFAVGNGANNQINAIALQPDGKVIIAGWFTFVNGQIRIRVARLHPNGSVDLSFNPSGAGFDQTNGADDVVSDVKLQPDGKVLISGLFRSYRTVQRNYVARLLSDGTVDPSFDPGTGPNDRVSVVALDANGRVLIGGVFTTVSGQTRQGIARLNANGTLDATFMGNGIASGGVRDIAVMPDGRILAGGSFVFYKTKSANNVVRILADGSHDPSFNSALPNTSIVSSLALQQSGKVIVGGDFTTPSKPGVSPQNNLARLNPNGTVDTSFKTGNGPNDEVFTISPAPGDKLVIGGAFSAYHGASRNRVARLFALTAPALRNISTRCVVQTGERVAIAGFIITGTGPKEVLLRGLGPSLGAQGVPDALQDPQIELYNSSGGLINSNNNWRDTQQNAIGETAIQPSDDRESALLINLGAGSYTVMLRGVDDTTGNGLIELYDLTGGSTAKLANISTRAFVGTGDSVMIGGFITEGDNARVVVRTLGPSLAAAGVPGALGDPRVALYDGNGDLVGFNLDWQDGQGPEIAATGLQPSDNREAALIVTLQAGNYTAVVEGSNETSGVGLVEVYQVQ